MSPQAYRSGFKTRHSEGIYYTTREDWTRYGVHMTATSPTAAEHNITAALSAHIERARKQKLIWC